MLFFNSGLFNLRGSDQLHLPFFTSYAIITPNENILFTAAEVTDDVKRHVESQAIALIYKPYTMSEITKAIEDILKSTTGKILITSTINAAIYNLIPSNRILQDFSPIEVLKSVKNINEAAGMVEASKRDSVAIIKYLHWLEENVNETVITEISGAERLTEFRRCVGLIILSKKHLFIIYLFRAEKDFKGLSFSTISAYGDHSALPHYGPTRETDRQITSDNIYIIDSGGQYLDGTTDVTRTIHLGKPSDFQKKAFTLVLKGHLAVNRERFITEYGSRFDELARAPLKKENMTYATGTGHGIGAYGNVHEYPPAIGSSHNSANISFAENMFTSNGNYKKRIALVLAYISS